MEIEGVQLLSYQSLLEQIAGQENHLLIGNGFNYGLGIDTSYKSIFTKMIEITNGLYKDFEDIVVECQHDLELFIGRLIENISTDNVFLKKFVSIKVKMDFMKATQELVKNEIKNVYAEKNEGIYLLLSQFDNYFTINFDPFLYLLLLHYKKPDGTLTQTVSL